jgi:hypothetical protein
MKKTVEIPEGYEARIEGNKVILEKKESNDERARKSLLEFLNDVWHMGKNANFDKWGKADCADWISYIEKQRESTWTEEDDYFVRNILPRILNPSKWTLEQNNADKHYLEEFIDRQKNKSFERQKELQSEEPQPIEWEWPNLSNCIKNCKKCYGKCSYRKEPYEEQKPIPIFKIGDKIKLKSEPKYPYREIVDIKDGAYYFDRLVYLPFEHQEEWEKEQKPAEYEKPLLSKFEQAVYDCAWDKVTCKPEGETQEEYAKRWAEQLLLIVRDWADDYIDSQIESAKRKAYDKEKADNEKPAEWSRQSIIDALTKWLTEKIAPLHKKSLDGTITEKEEMFEAALLEMRSLVNSPDFQIGKDTSAGWSKEDTYILEDAITAVDLLGNDAEYSKTHPNLAKAFRVAKDWLKCLPERFNLQPNWKPSEEQMEELFAAIEYLDIDGHEDTTVLNSLYNDLKNL